jgi:hypothetical protein
MAGQQKAAAVGLGSVQGEGTEGWACRLPFKHMACQVSKKPEKVTVFDERRFGVERWIEAAVG